MIAVLMGATLLATATPSGDSQQPLQQPQPPPSQAATAGPSAAEPAPSAAPASADARQGYRVHLDHAGRPTLPGPSPMAAPAATARVPRRPLVETEAAGGGSMIVLDDRFRSYATARVKSDGTVEVDCARGAASGATAGAAARAGGPGEGRKPAACTPSAETPSEHVR
jgi:hypothetical protein